MNFEILSGKVKTKTIIVMTLSIIDNLKPLSGACGELFRLQIMVWILAIFNIVGVSKELDLILFCNEDSNSKKYFSEI